MADDENPALKDQEEEEEERRRVCGFTFFQCGLCLLLLLLLGGIGGGVGGVLGTQSTSTGGGGASDTTDAPTSSPTATVVVTGTTAPSLPTAMPSLSPTSTFLPTSSPVTVSPSTSPSISPSASPEVSAPSASPSISVPTQGPTDSPTVTAPTLSPIPYVVPVLHHTKSSSQTLTGDANNVITFDTEVENTYPPTSFVGDTTYTIPDTGVYMVSTYLDMDTISANSVIIKIAGETVRRYGLTFTPYVYDRTSTLVKSFTAGETLTVDVELITTGGASTVSVTSASIKVVQISLGVPTDYAEAEVTSKLDNVYGNDGTEYAVAFDTVSKPSLFKDGNTTYEAPATGRYLVGAVIAANSPISSDARTEVAYTINGVKVENLLDLNLYNSNDDSFAEQAYFMVDLTAGQKLGITITVVGGGADSDDIDVGTSLKVFPLASDTDASFAKVAGTPEVIEVTNAGFTTAPELGGTLTPASGSPFNETDGSYYVASSIGSAYYCSMILHITAEVNGDLAAWNALNGEILVDGTPITVLSRTSQARTIALASGSDDGLVTLKMSYLHLNTEADTPLSWTSDLTLFSGTRNVTVQMDAQFIELF